MKKENDAFSTCNPIVSFTFFIGAIAFGMIFIHPAFLCASVLLSGVYYLTIKRGKGIKLLITLLPVFIALSLINPLFNTYGETVLFTYFNSRPYTLEALYYGMATASMFISVIVWFACYNEVMTSDKFIYIFGKLIPSLSLIFTMVLRLIPNYQRKITQISGARKCLGKAGNIDSKAQQAENGLNILSALTSWALEGAVITSDSMRSRGYGTVQRRTSFAIYSIDNRDRICLCFMLTLVAFILYRFALGAMSTTYTPILSIASVKSSETLFALIAYSAFLFTPSAMNIAENLIWKMRIYTSFNENSRQG